MPKVVDYAARFAFLRDAAFAVVSQDGTRHLTRPAIAEELGMSSSTVRRLLDPVASLEGLAAAQVKERRRRKRWGRGSESPRDLGVTLVSELIPDDERSAVTELVWWRLLIDSSASVHADPSADTPLALRDQLRLAEHGSLDAAPTPVPQRGRPDDELLRHIADREEEVTDQLEHVLDILEVPAEERVEERLTLRALVEGLTLAVCLRGLSTTEALGAACAHLDRLDRRPRPVDRAG